MAKLTNFKEIKEIINKDISVLGMGEEI